MTTIEIILAVAFVTYILFSGFAIYVMREVIVRQKAKMKHYKSAKYQREMWNKRMSEIHQKRTVKGMSEL
ncbi:MULTISPECIES: hypothetical protein [Streptococcus]|jgi:hypothetical protein|uniref:Uncharacterized protein n=1 Tax=Siphoviridae sp. ct7dP4 TaxID=2827787 RepID=A0A8S5TNP0_9CAUD|nr:MULTISPECIES: hypothetical protein [Streptococcus]MBF1717572.1 hypothetical protein [Streptococcus salivarius]QBX17703.1 hypothetical protein Javan371_0015 [Streptococcus phage Javan371]DAF64750.1 MAG TPA: protein of unknown function (DUF4083) [Siphoviridae sp. ct7dP4]DAN08530.1 MAG TPA: protein of unknown function (DUF4083) [Caudoviricetes sp.]EKS16571.1 hypothetical protein HMPREF9186_02010 [Streptococcus sp. F0442]